MKGGRRQRPGKPVPRRLLGSFCFHATRMAGGGMATDVQEYSDSIDPGLTMRMSRLVASTLLSFAVLLPALALAESWPSRPVRFVVPFPPGGTADLLGRLAAKEMQASLGQPVVVENRPGAGGVIGSDSVAKAAPDGYTLVLSNIASHAIGASVYARLPYDPLKAFTHIGLIAGVPSGIAVAANGPYTSLVQLLEKAGTAPGAVKFGSNGNGTSSHAKLEILNRAARVGITHVPYKGSAPATQDLLAGQIDGLIAAVPDVGNNPLVRLLAITTPARVSRWPDVPSVHELGIGPLVATNWFGMSGPAGIPAEVADKLNAALVAALNAPELAERLRSYGTEPNRLTPAEYTAMVAGDIARWADVVKAAGIRVE
jgi:tripartite-type tricarboxylate transporter receptor subunit TctC